MTFINEALHFVNLLCYIRGRQRVRTGGPTIIETGEAVNAARGSGGGHAGAGVLAETPAYRGGWRDGRFGLGEAFGKNHGRAAWEGADRVAYYRGYREGLRVRKMLG